MLMWYNQLLFWVISSDIVKVNFKNSFIAAIVKNAKVFLFLHVRVYMNVIVQFPYKHLF